MQQAQWDRTKSLFLSALELPEAERRPYLDRACEGDGETLRQVLELLGADARAATYLDLPVGEVAHEVLDGSVPMLRQIGRYRVESVLGKGGMGVVYLGVRDDLKSKVAIKVLRDAALSPMRREWFQREERLLAQLNHPSIARLFDADVLADGTPYFVMEYVEGEPLTAYCDHHGRTLGERLALLREASVAVQHAHRQAMIHRDLKPSNIMVARGTDGGAPSVKLLDFGIARELDDLAPSSRLLTASRLMTPAYAAPEQVRGEQVGVYTDVYALGVILYELLTGTLPYDADGRSRAEVEALSLAGPPEKPSLRASRLARSSSRTPAPFPSPGKAMWNELDVLCLTAMHHDAQRRYQTVEALVRDLDHLLAGEPLEARPDTLGYRAGKFVRRNRRGVAAAVVAVAAAVALLFFYQQTRERALAEATRTQRLQQFVAGLLVGDDRIALPESATVSDVLVRGIEQAKQFRSEPAFQASLFLTLGSIYRQIGNFPRADSLIGEALTRRREALGAENAEVAQSLVELGVLRMDEGKYDESEHLVREGLDMARRVAPDDHPTISEGMNALGMLHVQAGKYAEAIAELGEAIRLEKKRGADSVEIIETTNLLGNATYHAGRFTAADSHNPKVLAFDQKRLGPRHPSVAHSLVNLGNVLYERERWDEAAKLYGEALSIDSTYNGPEHLSVARDLLLVSRSLSRRGAYAEAQPLAERSRRLYEKTYGLHHPRTAIALSELGWLATKTRRFSEAESLLTQTVAICRETLGDDHAFVGSALGLLGAAYLDQGKLDTAVATYRHAFDNLTKALGSDNVITATTQVRFGRALLRRRQYDEAERQLSEGRRILLAHAESSPPSVEREARGDLIALYQATGRSADAVRLRNDSVAAGDRAGR
jgi:serine/threonine-protein kinase